MSVANLKCEDCDFEWLEKIDFLHIIYCPRCGHRK